MTTHSSTIQTAAHDWACQTLDIELSPDAVQQLPELLRLITQSDYVLSSDQANAAQIVTQSERTDGRPSIGSESISLWRQERGSQAIADFKATFFDLSCDERSCRWKLLVNEYADQPDLKWQLLPLERGLQIAMPTDPLNSRQEYLLRTCRKVFLGSPPDAARLRRIFCNQWSADDTWEDAVDEALENYGDVLQGLAPWIDEFGDQRFWESQEERPRPVLTNLIEAEVTRGEQMSVRPDLRPRQPRTELRLRRRITPGEVMSMIWIGITAFVIIITILLLLYEGPAVIPIDTHPARPFPLKPNVPFR